MTAPLSPAAQAIWDAWNDAGGPAMSPTDLLWLAIAVPIAACLILRGIAFLLLAWMIRTKPFPFV